ncbi:Auxin efflux carrier [Corchorus capsularis]|uniref:Auxin efflux carrier n=1 Tax=Corchorus capsularis TaxID=210143 RepID=A0A1R3GTB6_COCAP|nr:Auxin efflux carrier [Corchorus capsularis]
MGFLELFVVAVKPVLKVLLVTGVGLFLALDQINLLGPEARNYLNKIVFYVLSPSLLVSNLAETITYKSLATLWFMPVNVLLTYMIGSALGWILIKITKTPKHLQGIVIGSCCAGNLGNLPLIVVPAVCEESNSPFADSPTCSTDAEVYASLSLAVGSLLTWSYAFSIVRAYAVSTGKNSSQSSGEVSEPSLESCKEALLPSSYGPYGEISEDTSVRVELPPMITSYERTKIPFWEKIVQCGKSITSKIDLKKIFAPSTIASIIGIIFGIVSPIRKLLVGDNAPLHVIDTSAALIGQAAIPCETLIMGSNLLKGIRRSEMNLLVIIGILAVRSVLLPLSGIGVTKAAYHFGMVGSSSLYQFVLMFQYAVPPAINIGTMTQLFQSGQGETSVILLCTYAVASISLTLWSTLFMSLVA